MILLVEFAVGILAIIAGFGFKHTYLVSPSPLLVYGMIHGLVGVLVLIKPQSETSEFMPVCLYC